MTKANAWERSDEERVTDDPLIALIADGDTNAFAELYNRYWEALYQTAFRMLRSDPDAADVVQDVFVSLWKRRKELSLSGPVAAYLHTGVKYKSIHFIERNITRRNYLALLTESEALSDETPAEARLHLKEIREVVEREVGKMPDKMRAVYRLSRDEQLSHKEIAQRMQISPLTVKKYVHQALGLIRRAIDDTGIELPVLLGLIFFKK